MKKRLYYKKWKQELREDVMAYVDGEDLTEKMVRKMSFGEMNHFLRSVNLKEAGYCGTMYAD